MTIYLVLYCLLGMLGYWNYRVRAERGHTQPLAARICFFLVLALLALRHPSMGRDLGYYSDTGTGYLQSFEVLTRYPWNQLLVWQGYLNYEPGYILLNKLLGMLWQNRQFFLAVCAFLSLLPVGGLIEKRSCSPVLSWVIYLALPIFEILYSGLRQGIALGLCALALVHILDRKPLRFVLTVLCASLFHDSCLVFLVAYPIFGVRATPALRVGSIFAVPVVFVLRGRLFSLAAGLFGNYGADNNGAFGLMLLFVLIYVLCCLFVREEDPEQRGLLNIFYLCCICQVFASVSSLALRIGYYFILPLVLLLPRVLENMERRLRIIAKLAVIVFFVAFGLRCIYISTWSEAYPYYWFWQSPGIG